jgi:hypothetical protein
MGTAKGSKNAVSRRQKIKMPPFGGRVALFPFCTAMSTKLRRSQVRQTVCEGCKTSTGFIAKMPHKPASWGKPENRIVEIPPTLATESA